MEKKIRYRNRGRILGGVLMLCSIIFLFLAFIGPNPVALGVFMGGLSPFMTFIASFAMYLSNGAGIAMAVFYQLLFICAFVFPILTGIFILVNKKYFPTFIATIIYGVLALLFIIACIVIDAGMGFAYGSTLGIGVGRYFPTIWLFLGLAMVIVPVFIVRKEVILPPPPPKPEPVDNYEKTIASNKSNLQGIEIQIRYTDNSGSHTVKREIYSDAPLTIGREDRCKLVLVDRRVSGIHAKLYYDDLNGMVIEDCDSSNGVQVNGDTIMRKARITQDDSVRLGDCKLAFRVLGKLDELDGEVTIAAGARYHEPLRVHFNFADDSGNRRENVMLREVITLGRDRDCEVSFDSNTVSRKHARVRNLGGHRISIEDNDSWNSVLVNGAKIESVTELHTGDVVTLGDVNITVTF